jgi:hypothetical protein
VIGFSIALYDGLCNLQASYKNGPIDEIALLGL